MDSNLKTSIWQQFGAAIDYLEATINAFPDQLLTDEIAQRHCRFGWGELSFLELLIYNLRHVQEHSAQLNMLLGQNGVATPDYPTQVINTPS
jgi:hypothetical protein